MQTIESEVSMYKQDDFIEKLKHTLPDPCRTKDLIEARIYNSEQAAAAARRRGNCPTFFKLNERVVMYSKADVIAYMQSKRHATQNVISMTPERKKFITHVRVVPQ